MTARLISLLVWTVVLATAVAWGLRLSARGQAVPAHALVADNAPPQGGDFTRLLGTAPVQPVALAEAAPPPADSRFKLVGVVAPRGAQGGGLALVSVDGKPARAVPLGREVEPGLRVLKVAHRRVELGGDGAATVVLELLPLPEPNRGRPGDVAAAMPGVPPGLGQAGMLRPPAGMVLPQPGAAQPFIPQPMVMPQPQPMALPPGARMPMPGAVPVELGEGANEAVEAQAQSQAVR